MEIEGRYNIYNNEEYRGDKGRKVNIWARVTNILRGGLITGRLVTILPTIYLRFECFIV